MLKAEQVSVGDAKNLAIRLAKSLRGGEIFGLIGPLGAGKTTFTQHLARELKIRGRLKSPTFIIMQSLPGKLPKSLTGKSTPIVLHHLDLYRLHGKKEISQLGLEDFLGKKNTVTVIEWADRAKKWLPTKTRYIYFT
jgi:tRNA threonylcarbamoyladenosine biosynthesis protein TsaE